jgi:hypothetical protein
MSILVPGFSLKDHTLLRSITVEEPPPEQSCIPMVSIVGSVTNTLIDGVVSLTKSGDTVFVNSDATTDRFTAIDVSTPTAPVVLDSLRNAGLLTAQQIVSDGTYAYVTCANGIAVVDLGTPGFMPVADLIDSTQLSGAYGIIKEGNLLYIGCNTRFTIVDVSTPLNPVVVGSLLDAATLNNSRGVVKVGNYVFVGSSGNSLFVVLDVSTPSTPTFVTSLSGTTNFGNAAGVTVDGNYAYVAANAGLTVVDISTPTTPTVAGRVSQTGDASQPWGIVKDGNTVYTITRTTTAAVRVFDVTTPTAPTAVTDLTISGSTQTENLVKSGSYLYVSGPTAVTVIDVTTPSSPSQVGQLINSVDLAAAKGMLVDGSTVYVAGEDVFTALDISSPTTPTVDWNIRGNLFSAPGPVVTIGDHVFMAATATGSGGTLSAFDVSDPNNLIHVSTLKHADISGLGWMATDGTYIYLTITAADKITVIDVSNPAAMSIVTTLIHATNLDGALGCAIQGDYLYVACQNADRLAVVDISNPASPSITGTVQDAINLDQAQRVAVNGNYAYVTAINRHRLTVVDVSNPASPSIVGTVSSGALNQAFDVVYDDGRCFVSCVGGDAVTVVDVSNPATPVVMSSLTMVPELDFARSIIKDGDLFYVAAAIGDRMTVLDFNPCVLGAGPTVTINQSASQVDPTNIASIVFDVVFSESVTGFTSASLSFTGSTAGGTLAGAVAGSGTTYTVTVTGMTSSGTVVASVPIGGGVNASGFISQASTSTDNSVFFCNPALTISSIYRSDEFALPQTAVYDDGYYYFISETSTSAQGLLGIIDVSVPEIIARIQSNQVWSVNRGTMVKQGNYLYIGTVTQGIDPLRFTIVDVSNPAAPTIASSITHADIDSGIAILTVSDNYVYCYCHSNRLTVFDVSNPAAPVSVYSAVDATNLPTTSNAMLVAGNYLYVTSALGHGVWNISTPSSPSHVGNVGGISRHGIEIIQDGNLLWHTGSSTVGSIDITTPTDSFSVGQCDVPNHTNSQSRFSKSGNYGAVISQSRLSVVDLTNRPRKIKTVGTVTSSNLDSAVDVEVDGTWAYIQCGLASGGAGGRFVTVDISTPTAPSVSGVINLSASSVNPGRIHKSGNHVYVPSISLDTLYIINVTTPSTPSVAGSVTNATTVNQVSAAYKSGNYCYLTSTEAGGRFVVVDVSNPASPSVTASVTGTDFGPARAIIVSGNYAFIGKFDGTIAVVDVSTPASPTHVTTTATTMLSSAIVESLTLSGNTLVAFGTAVGFGAVVTALDVSTPTSPVIVDYIEHSGGMGSSGCDVVADGDYAYAMGVATFGTLMGGVQVLDISDPSDLNWVGHVAGRTLTDDSVIYGGSIAQLNDTLYIGNTSAHIASSINVSDPDRPFVSNAYTEPHTLDGHAIDIGVDADGVYLIADDARGYMEFNHTLSTITEELGDSTSAVSEMVLDGTNLWTVGPGYLAVLDVSNPTSPTQMGWSALGPTAQNNVASGLAISGDYAYIANANDSIYVFDISTPTDPQLVTSIVIPHDISSTNAIVIQGNYLYMRTNTRFTVVDISNPAAPTYVTSINDATNLDGANRNCLVVDGTFAYTVANNVNRFLVIDISTPATPTIIGNIQNATTLATPRCLTKDGNFCYVGTNAGTGRLTVINVAVPTTPSISGSLLSTSLGAVSAVVKLGHYVYCSNASTSVDRVTVVNVLNPGTPTLHSSVLDAVNLNTSLDMVAVDDLFYVAGGGQTFGWITIVDGACPITTTPPTVATLRSISLTSPYGGVSTDGVRLAVTRNGADAISIYNISDINNITLYTSGTHGTFLDQTTSIGGGVIIEGPWVYVSAFGNRLQIINTDNFYPSLHYIGDAVDSDLFRDPKFIVKQGDFVYGTAGAPGFTNEGRLTIIDVSQPDESFGGPVFRGSVHDSRLQGGGSNLLAVNGNYVYVAAESTILGARSLTVVDVTDKDNPFVAGAYTNTLFDSDIYAVEVNYPYVYVTSGSRFAVVDVSTPSAPTLVTSILLTSGHANGLGIKRVGNYVYFTGTTTDSVRWVNISSPAAPSYSSTFNVLTDITLLDGALFIDEADGIMYVLAPTSNLITLVSTLT